MHGIDFFRDEVRNGFYIPTAIKQAWAAELDVLAEIDRICGKYGITYFADWGTMLGAVRHGGFVPWDDDLDICMKRADYERFRQVCDNELPKGYVIHDYARKENHWLFLSRVVNQSHFCFEEDHLRRFYNFPWLASVDIFVLDYLYPDEEDEKARDEEILWLIAIADHNREGGIAPERMLRYIEEINEKYRIGLCYDPDPRAMAIELYRLAERQMSRVPESRSEKLGQIFPFVLKGDRGRPKEFYEDIIRLPFEDTQIPVPSRYVQLLSAKYGNFCEIRKVWTGHDYPFFAKQREEMERVAGESLPGFVFPEEALNAWTKPIVPGDGSERCGSGANKKREVLFLPIGPDEWKGFEPVYRRESAREDTKVTVVPLPLMPKDIYGQVWLSEYEIIAAGKEEDYPETLCLTHWWDYDVAAQRQDVIYIQWQYDEWNPYLTVPADYYAANLRHYTEKLVFKQAWKTAEFGEEDRLEQINAKIAMRMPGVVYADEVLAQSENIRQQYISILTAFSGRNTEDYWRDKLQVDEEAFGVTENLCGGERNAIGRNRDSEKKQILFCIGLHIIAEESSGFLERLRARLEIFRGAADSVRTTVRLYPPGNDAWKSAGEAAYGKLEKLLEEFKDCLEISEDGMWQDIESAGTFFDAYYGSPSPYVPEFVVQKKPVMIADYQI